MVSEASGKQPLPSGPTTLCFSKEQFMKDNFHVEEFVVECRRKVPTETLRDDLSVYMKVLQSAMIELINKDYADFVNLSSNLVGMDKAINTLTTPLEQLQKEVTTVQKALDEAVVEFDAKRQKQARIREKKASLQRLMNILQSVDKMEKLLGIQLTESQGGIHYTSDLSGQLIERVATEFNKLQFYVNKSRGAPLVEDIKPRIANITSVLQYNLEGSFREGLETGDVGILRQCLRTYATIDKMRDAENLFQQHVVRPYMEEVISEQFIRDNPQGLRGMYQAITDFIPSHCKKLKEVTAGTAEGSAEVVRGYDFLVNSVWQEVVSNIEAKTPSIFAPGNPDVFRQKYCESLEFVDQFERLCGCQASVKRLRSHPAFTTFMSKWSLPVYFQIRFQDIAGALETALMDPFLKSTSEPFQLNVTAVLWECMMRCWQDDCYLSALCHRFWKLTLQLASRYVTWMKEVQEILVQQTQQKVEGDHGNNGNHKSEGTITSHADNTQCSPDTQTETLTKSQLVCLIVDAQTISKNISDIYQDVIVHKIRELGVQNIAYFEEAIEDCQQCIQEPLPKFTSHITEDVTRQCAIGLKFVSDIPRLYRKTNRDIPTKGSSYVSSLVKPLQQFLHQEKHVVNDQLQQDWCLNVLGNIAEQYYEVTSDVLTSVKKMEESLKRLKRSRTAASDLKSMSHGGMSDDDKMRLQLYLDVKDFGNKINGFDVKKEDIDSYTKLYDLVESENNKSQ